MLWLNRAFFDYSDRLLDEYAMFVRKVWTEVLRPALADRQGRALFIGTPRGRNHFFDLYEAAQELPNWATFQFTTEEGGNVTPEELESATHDMDERAFGQEFKAKFDTLGVGRAYHAFDPVHNIRGVKFDRRAALSGALDFNMNPFCSVLAHGYQGRVQVLEEMI